MTNIELPYFGQIEFNQINEYYFAEIEHNEMILRLDLNFETKSMSTEEIGDIKKFLENISAFDVHNKTKITNDFNNEGESKNYVKFYFEECDDEELSRIIDYQKTDKPKDEQLLHKLRLIRVGLYPDDTNNDEYGIFDYSIDIDGEPCNQLLVVKTDKNGNPNLITWES